jgi:predicted O-methyltransferase YrrM
MKITLNPDRINHISVNGVPASQHFNIVEAVTILEAYLKMRSIKLARIIEIGTLNGGFTTLLANHRISENADIHTFDIQNALDAEYIKKSNTTHHYQDVFHNSKTVEDLITAEGTALVFCDGGDKIKEFNYFSQFLKPGDLIFCHDYAVDGETFYKHILYKVWNWHQIGYSDIAHSLKEHNLQPCLSDVFELVVWGSFIKS